MAYQKKAPEDRIGHSHGAGQEVGRVTKGKTKRDGIPIPTASDRWLPQARSWYNSLALSGQSEFYEASDWATAVCAAEAYDLFCRTRNSSILANFVKLSERLCVTITDRKRARLELADPEPSDRDEDAADETIRNWHQRLGVPIHPVK